MFVVDVVCGICLFVVVAVPVDFAVNDVCEGAVVDDDEADKSDEGEGEDGDEGVVECVNHCGDE